GTSIPVLAHGADGQICICGRLRHQRALEPGAAHRRDDARRDAAQGLAERLRAARARDHDARLRRLEDSTHTDGPLAAVAVPAIGAELATAEPQGARGGRVDYPERDGALLQEPDHDHELAIASDELAGAIQRIDEA